MPLSKLALVAATALLAATGAAQAQTYQLTLAGASPGGLWSLLGVGVDKAVKAEFPGSTVTYQTSGGGFANVALLETKKAELGIVEGSALRLAVTGAPPFKQTYKDLRAIAVLYNWGPMQLVMSKAFADKHGIKTFEDIAAKKPPLRVAVNRRGNIAEGVAESMFKAAGIAIADIQKWGGQVVYAASEEQSDLMRDRRIDMIFNSLFMGQRSILEVAQAVEVVMLPVAEKTITTTNAEMGTERFVMPKSGYPFMTADVPVPSIGATLVVNAGLDEATAFNLTRALVKQVEQMRGVHPSMKALTPELMASQNVIPYHPGAQRFYKEAKLMN
ncbi:MAG: TAXI family TRAP transporter solute-binding subunit [Alphaproteobacteria bacterium]|nr:TAXI family TRAP transporter solute-binding subunit [Alphaproteobacteria bacterium]